MAHPVYRTILVLFSEQGYESTLIEVLVQFWVNGHLDLTDEL